MPALQSGDRRAEWKKLTPQAKQPHGSVRLAASRLPVIAFRPAKSWSGTQTRTTCRQVDWKPCWTDSVTVMSNCAQNTRIEGLERLVGEADLGIYGTQKEDKMRRERLVRLRA
jgi:hypothetical protein